MGIQPVIPNIPTAQQPIAPVQASSSSSSLINQSQVSNGDVLLIDSLVDVNAIADNILVDNTIIPVNAPNVVPTSVPVPAPPTPPSGTQSRSMSISEKAPSIESPGSTPSNAIEWAIKGPAKLKYTQLFNTTGKRSILLKT